MKKIFLFPITWGIVAALLVTVPQLHHSQFRDDDYVQLAVLARKVTYPWMGPFNDTAAFLTALPSKFAAMLGELFLGAQSSRWYFPQLRTEVVILGAAAVVLFGILLFPLWKQSYPRKRRRILWMITGMLGSLIPLSGRTPNPHVLIIPFIGGSVLVGFILFYWWRRIRKRINILNVLGILVCAVLVYVQLIRPPFYWFGASAEWQTAHERLKAFHEQPVLKELQPHHKAIFLNFSNWSFEFHGYYYRKLYDLPMPGAWWRLTTSAVPPRYHRTGDNKLEMEIIPNGEIPGKGRVVRLPGLRVTVPSGETRGAAWVEFEFDRSLDNDMYRFLVWRDGRLFRIEVPPVGQSIPVGGK